MSKERFLTILVPIKDSDCESGTYTVETLPDVDTDNINKIYKMSDGTYRRLVLNPSTGQYEYQAVIDREFPYLGRPLEIFDFTYDATRMGTAPTISAQNLMWFADKDENGNDVTLEGLWTQECHVTFNGENFYLQLIPTSSKSNEDARYKYDIDFVSERKVLETTYFYDVVSPFITEKPVSENSKFSFFGDINELAKRLNASMIRSGLATLTRKYVNYPQYMTDRVVPYLTYEQWNLLDLDYQKLLDDGVFPPAPDDEISTFYFWIYNALGKDYNRYLMEYIYENVDGVYAVSGYRCVIGKDKKGDVSSTDGKLLTFENNTIHEALQKFHEEFELQYYIVKERNQYGAFTGNTNIVVADCEHDFADWDEEEDDFVRDEEGIPTSSDPLDYGSTEALLSKEKANTTDKIVTRITGVGSTENIPWHYPNPNPDGWIKPLFKRNGAEQVAVDVDYPVTEGSTLAEASRYEKYLKNRIGNALKKGIVKDLVFTNEYKTLNNGHLVVQDKMTVHTVYNINTEGITLPKITMELDYHPLQSGCSKVVATLKTGDTVIGSYDSTQTYENPTSFQSMFINGDGSDAVILNTGFSYFLDITYTIPLSSVPNSMQYNYEGYHYPATSIEISGAGIYAFVGENFYQERGLQPFVSLSGTVGIVDAGYSTDGTAAGKVAPIPRRRASKYKDIQTGTIYRCQRDTPSHDITTGQPTGVFSANPNMTSEEWIRTFVQMTIRVYSNYGWYIGNKQVDLEEYGLGTPSENGTPIVTDIFDTIEFQRVKWVTPQPNLMPEVYIRTDGERRFYNAHNYWDKENSTLYVGTADTAIGEVQSGTKVKNPIYKENETDPDSKHYEFENEFVSNVPHEHIEDFDDVKPTIKGQKNHIKVSVTEAQFNASKTSYYTKNVSGEYIQCTNASVYDNKATYYALLRIDVIEEFAYDTTDNDEIWETSEHGSVQGEYKHPYFFAKLRPLGFNLFDMALQDDMVVSMTTGHCGACNFKIGVNESTLKNPVQVWEYDVYGGETYAARGTKIHSKGDLRRYEDTSNLYYDTDGTQAGYVNVNNGLNIVGGGGQITYASSMQVYESNVYSEEDVANGLVGSMKHEGKLHFEGDVVTNGRYIASQQDTTEEYVWVALMKDTDAYGVLMPSTTPSEIRPSSVTDVHEEGSTMDEDDESADKFVLVNIRMPQVYIRRAERDLSRKLVAHMYDNNYQKYNFSIKFSRIYLAQNEDIDALLNENSVLYVTFNNKTYRQYVKHYSYKMTSDVVLPEIAVDMNEELSVTKTFVEQQAAVMAKNNSILVGHATTVAQQAAERVARKVSASTTPTPPNTASEIGKEAEAEEKGSSKGETNLWFGTQEEYDDLESSGQLQDGVEYHIITQSDWDEKDAEKMSYIKHKPSPEGKVRSFSPSGTVMRAEAEGYIPKRHTMLGVEFDHDVPSDASLELRNGGETTDSDATYVDRKTGGAHSSDVGGSEARLSGIKGNTVAWNQMVPDNDWSSTNWMSASNGTLSIQNGNAKVTCVSDGTIALMPYNNINVIANHKYYVKAIARGSDASKYVRLSTVFSGIEPRVNSTTFATLTMIGSRTSDFAGRYPSVIMQEAVVGDYIEVKSLIGIDLTLMFGAGNEPTTVEQFEAWLASNVGLKDYYPYDAGSLLSVMKPAPVSGWNQLVRNGNFSEGNGVWYYPSNTKIIADNNELSIIGTSSTQATSCTMYQGTSSIKNGHKYYCKSTTRLNTTNTYSSGVLVHLGYLGGGSSSTQWMDGGVDIENIKNKWYTQRYLLTANSDKPYIFFCVYKFGNGFFFNNTTEIRFKNCMVVDLTLLGIDNFTTVEQVEQWLDEHTDYSDYYEYNNGNVPYYKKLLGIESVGFNQWDEEWEVGRFRTTTGEDVVSNNQIRAKDYIHVIPSGTYYFNVPSYVWVMFFDANKNIITSGLPTGNYDTVDNCLAIGEIFASIVVMPSNCHYIRFYCQAVYGTTYNHDICINLSDSTLNGTYKPYKKSVSNFDVTKIYGRLNGTGDYVQVFPDGLKKADYAGTVRDELDFVNRTATVNVGNVDLGTLTWTYETSYTTPIFTTNRTNINVAKQSSKILSTIYTPVVGFFQFANNDMCICTGNENLNVSNSSYTVASTFKTAMSGVYINYELATPLTYTDLVYREDNVDTPLTQPSYLVENGGTEHQLIPQGNNGEVKGIAATLTTVYQNADTNAVTLPIKRNGFPIKEGDINGGATAMFYCDGEAYHLVNTEYQLVDRIDEHSNGSQYPSAKAIYDSWKQGQPLFSREYLKSKGNWFAPLTSTQANDGWLGSYYFMDLIPTSEEWADLWWVSYRMHIYGDKSIGSGKFTQGIYDCYICMAGTTFIYKMFNNISSTSYYPIYHHTWLYYDTAAKYANRREHPIQIGFRMTSAYTATTIGRDARIEILGYGGCEVRLKDPVLYENVWSTDNYNKKSTIDATSQGLQETGDITDVVTVRLSNTRLTAGTNGLKMYSLCMQDGDGNWQSFTTGTGGTQTTKVPNISTGFRLLSPRYYLYMSADVASGTNINNSIVTAHITLVDFTYSTNITNTNGQGLYAYKPLYIVGTVHSDGLFYLDSKLDELTGKYSPWWTQDEPTYEDGKVYIKVTEAIYPDYNVTSYPTRNYRGDLIYNAPPMWFKNGKFQEFVPSVFEESGNTECFTRVHVGERGLIQNTLCAFNCDDELVSLVTYDDKTTPATIVPNTTDIFPNGCNIYFYVGEDVAGVSGGTDVYGLTLYTSHKHADMRKMLFEGTEELNKSYIGYMGGGRDEYEGVSALYLNIEVSKYGWGLKKTSDDEVVVPRFRFSNYGTNVIRLGCHNAENRTDDDWYSMCLDDNNKMYTYGEDENLHERMIDTHELTVNKVTSVSSGSTDDEYPSAKCVYDLVGNIETLLSAI